MIYYSRQGTQALTDTNHKRNVSQPENLKKPSGEFSILF